MYINFNVNLNIIYLILALLGCIALVYIIITIKNLNKLLKNSNEIIECNKSEIHNSLEKLPEVISNFRYVSENVKDVTEVVTDVTADFIVKKESMKSNIDILTDILNILKSVFGK